MGTIIPILSLDPVAQTQKYRVKMFRELRYFSGIFFQYFVIHKPSTLDADSGEGTGLIFTVIPLF